MACSVVAVRLDELSLYLTPLQTIIMSFVIKREGLPNLSDRGSRWGTTVCVFINKIGWILSEFGICGTFRSTTYPMIQERFANLRISRLNRKFKIMFPSRYLTFGTEKTTQLKKSHWHICLIIPNMVSNETHEKASWPVLLLCWVLLYSLVR